MKYKAILFDMDGTLLPMNVKEFTNYYFKMFYKKLAKYNIELQSFIDAMWKGVAAMTKNDGSKTNEDVFWDCFESITGLKKEVVGDTCESFYMNEFHAAKAATKENPLALKAVQIARSKADKVVLATNPLFPMVGQISRMSWVGLKPEDFDLVTSYESDSTCKPNPDYFLSVCKRIDVDPKDCLMIGNDCHEDMYAARLAGLDTYLVEDCLIEDIKNPYDGLKGSFNDLMDYLSNLD